MEGKKKKNLRKIPDGTKNVKALFNMAGYGAPRGGRGEKLSLQNVCARGKKTTRARKTTGAVSFGGHGRAAANEIRSVRLAFPWEFFSAAVLSVQSTRAQRRREPSSPATPSPHLPHPPPVRATLPLSLLCQSRKEENKKKTLTRRLRVAIRSGCRGYFVVGESRIGMLLVAGFFVFFSRPLLLAKIKQITGRIFAIIPPILKLFQPFF